LCLRLQANECPLSKQKNKANRLIVICDNDGYSKLGIQTTTMFIEKGFDNVVLLSGGLWAVGEKFPFRIFGELPERPLSPGSKAFSRSTSKNPSIAGSKVSSRAPSPPRSPHENEHDNRSKAGQLFEITSKSVRSTNSRLPTSVTLASSKPWK